MILPSAPSPPTAAQIAVTIDNQLVGDVPSKVGKHQRLWQLFWMNAVQDPAAIASAYDALQAGATAFLFYAAAADVAILQNAATQAGVTLSQLVGAAYAQYMAPPIAYTVGTVTPGQPVSITLNSGWTRVVSGQAVSLVQKDGGGNVLQTILP